MRMIIVLQLTAPAVKSKSLSPDSHLHLTDPPPLRQNQQAVLDALSQQPQAVSAQDLHGILRQQRTIGLATVYRALETLKLRGLVQSRASGNGEALYSSVAQDQHYLTCLQCRRSFPLDHCPVQSLEAQVQPAVPFKIYYHTLEFFGLCEPCTQASD
jgi:Fur family transcriptional regulator, ferric uptake regulator